PSRELHQCPAGRVAQIKRRRDFTKTLWLSRSGQLCKDISFGDRCARLMWAWHLIYPLYAFHTQNVKPLKYTPSPPFTWRKSFYHRSYDPETKRYNRPIPGRIRIQATQLAWLRAVHFAVYSRASPPPH